ncbi:ferritin-like domain-containing protein [Caldimonas tepidiphila]|uniref:ferritin-like domain-containing protein n=1 Tax=Caldimonas tepidiphila TaxID=2315841 RepID=UPI00196B6F31|nr:ferritin-like domain-containing protein [Caldimonas tepidiphila]
MAMKPQTHVGRNRTGIQMSPLDIREMREGTDHTVPTSLGDKEAVSEMRQRYISESDTIGSVPVPGTLTGMLETGKGFLTGRRPQVLIDKLGERLAFERSGVRLYDALLAKCEADPASLGAGAADRLRHFRMEEAQHFAMVADALDSIGADPTAQTPCADMVGVEGMGMMQVLTDPRTSVSQCLHVILDAELVDNAGWELLITLSRQSGHPELAERFAQALHQENQHLVEVRRMYEASVLAEATGSLPADRDRIAPGSEAMPTAGGGLFHDSSPGEDNPPIKGTVGGGSANGLDPTAPRGAPGSEGQRDQGSS